MAGCASILVRPAADNIKTVALISVFMNRDFYDVKDPRTSVSITNLNKPQDKEYEAIINYGIKS